MRDWLRWMLWINKSSIQWYTGELPFARTHRGTIFWSLKGDWEWYLGTWLHVVWNPNREELFGMAMDDTDDQLCFMVDIFGAVSEVVGETGELLYRESRRNLVSVSSSGWNRKGYVYDPSWLLLSKQVFAKYRLRGPRCLHISWGKYSNMYPWIVYLRIGLWSMNGLRCE